MACKAEKHASDLGRESTVVTPTHGMADDELAAMRAKVDALTQAAEASSLQTALAANVRERMERIDSIMQAATSSEVDEEVEAWRRKIEELSQPVTAVAVESPPHDTAVAASDHALEVVTAPPGAVEHTRHASAPASAPASAAASAAASAQEPARKDAAAMNEAVPTCMAPSCAVM